MKQRAPGSGALSFCAGEPAPSLQALPIPRPRASPGLDLRLAPLRIQAPSLGRARRLGLAPTLGLVRRGREQRAEAVKDRRSVSLLRALGLGGDVDFAGAGDA